MCLSNLYQTAVTTIPYSLVKLLKLSALIFLDVLSGVPGSMARMTVLTKPDALAQPRRHRAKRRPQRAVRIPAGAEQGHPQPAAAGLPAAETGTASREAGAGVQTVGSILKEALMQPMRPAGEDHSRAEAGSALTADEVVRSLLQPRGPAAPPSPSGGLTELMGLIQSNISRGAAPATQAGQPGQSVAPARPSSGLVEPQVAAPAAAAANANNLQQAAAFGAVVSAAIGNACQPMEERDVQAADDDEEEGTAVAEPAWRTRGSAAARRDGQAQTAVALKAQLRESVRSLHSTLAAASSLGAHVSAASARGEDLAQEASDVENKETGWRRGARRLGQLNRASAGTSGTIQAPSSAPAAGRKRGRVAEEYVPPCLAWKLPSYDESATEMRVVIAKWLIDRPVS
jgi:hypothetical protein